MPIGQGSNPPAILPQARAGQLEQQPEQPEQQEVLQVSLSSVGEGWVAILLPILHGYVVALHSQEQERP